MNMYNTALILSKPVYSYIPGPVVAPAAHFHFKAPHNIKP